MNNNFIRRVLILTKSMVTKNTFKKPGYKMNEFEVNFNEENLRLGKSIQAQLKGFFKEVDVMPIVQAFNESTSG